MLHSTIFSFPEQTCVNWCLSCTVMNISTPQRLPTFVASFCVAFQTTTTIVASTYSNLSQLTIIVLLQTLLTWICSTCSAGSTCIYISLQQCVLEWSFHRVLGQSASSNSHYWCIQTLPIQSDQRTLTWKPSSRLSDPHIHSVALKSAQRPSYPSNYHSYGTMRCAPEMAYQHFELDQRYLCPCDTEDDW